MRTSRRMAGTIMAGTLIATLVATFIFGSSAQAESWPQWAGPNRNWTTSEKAGVWPPEFKWNKSLGDSDSSPIIVNGKVYVLELYGSNTRVRCFDAETGNDRGNGFVTENLGDLN